MKKESPPAAAAAAAAMSPSASAVNKVVTKKIMTSYPYVGIWITLSSAVVVYNKYILDPKMLGWTFPISLTIIHMAVCSVLAFLLVRVARLVDPLSSPPMSFDLYVSSIIPIGALYSLSLWFSNSAYIHLSISFIQILKALMPVADYSLSVLFNNQTFKFSSVADLLAISVGVAVSAYGEARFDAWGVALQLSAITIEAARFVLIRILLNSNGIKLNPIVSLYYVAPCCLLFLIVPWIAVEAPMLMRYSATSLTLGNLLLFGMNALCVFALNLAVFLLVEKTSLVTTSVAGVVRDWLLIGFSWSVIRDTVTATNLIGYGISFSGVAYYSYLLLQAMKEAVVRRMMAEQEDEESGSLLLEERDEAHQLNKNDDDAQEEKIELDVDEADQN